MPSVRLGLIDSGIGRHQSPRIRRFRCLTGSGEPHDRLGHGAAIIETLSRYVALSSLDIFLVKLFDRRLTTGVEQLTSALEWQAESPPDWLLCSLGVQREEPRLRAAVERLLAAGTRIVASSARAGGPVYPASWHGVRAVSGQAGMGPGVLQRGPDGRWYACVWAAMPGDWQPWMPGPPRRGQAPALGGSSFAAAHALGYWLAADARSSPD